MYNKVRYIGKPDFSKEVLVGIDLDSWSPNARDGSAHGQQIFKTSEGRGFFAPLRSVAKILVKSKVTEGSYARLKGLYRVPKFNGKTVKIVVFIERQDRWKVKLLHAKQEKKYLGVKEEHLDPILDWEPLNNPNHPLKKALKEYPKVGDQVETREGQMGTVKYVGPVEFGSNHDDLWIGLSLHQWNPNGHNGTVRNKRYFETEEGRGYFVRLEQLIENMGLSTLKQMEVESEVQSAQQDIAPLSTQNDNTESDENTRRRLIARTRKKLRRIEALEFKKKSGVQLHSSGIAEIQRKEELQAKMKELTNASSAKEKQEDSKSNCMTEDNHNKGPEQARKELENDTEI